MTTGWQGAVGPGAAESAGRLGAGFDLVLILHVTCVVIGLATVVVSGIVAGRLAAALPSVPPAQVLRYYAPGINWAGRILVGVPVFGFVLLAMSHGAYGLDDAWVMEGLALWVVVVGLAEGVLWPTERRLQVLLNGAGDDTMRNGAANEPPRTAAGAGSPRTAGRPIGAPHGEVADGGENAIRRACRTIRWVSAVAVVTMVLATVLMVAQP